MDGEDYASAYYISYLSAGSEHAIGMRSEDDPREEFRTLSVIDSMVGRCLGFSSRLRSLPTDRTLELMAGSRPPARVNGHGLPGVRGIDAGPPDGPLFDVPPVLIRRGDTSEGTGLYDIDGRALTEEEAEEWTARFSGEAPRLPLAGDSPEVVEYLGRLRPPPTAPAPPPSAAPTAAEPTLEAAHVNLATAVLRRARIVAELHQVHETRRQHAARGAPSNVVIYGPDQRPLVLGAPLDAASAPRTPGAPPGSSSVSQSRRAASLPRAWLHVIGLELLVFAGGLHTLGDPLPPYGALALAAIIGWWLPQWVANSWGAMVGSGGQAVGVRWITKLLRALAYTWIMGAALVVLLGLMAIWWYRGFSALQETLSPFNVWQWLASVALVGPGIIGLRLAEWLKARRACPAPAGAILARPAPASLPTATEHPPALSYVRTDRIGTQRAGPALLAVGWVVAAALAALLVWHGQPMPVVQPTAGPTGEMMSLDIPDGWRARAASSDPKYALRTGEMVAYYLQQGMNLPQARAAARDAALRLLSER
jgi:hypothetical protein